MNRNLVTDYDIQTTPQFKLKDSKKRLFQIIDLKHWFSKQPELISVEKIPGQNNTFIVRAFIPKEEK